MLACPRVLGDECSQSGIGAFDESGETLVPDLGAALCHLIEKACDRIWDRDTAARTEELPDLVDGPPPFDCGE